MNTRKQSNILLYILPYLLVLFDIPDSAIHKSTHDHRVPANADNAIEVVEILTNASESLNKGVIIE